MRTLLTGAVIVTCDEQRTVYARGDLVLESDCVSWVGESYTGEYSSRIFADGFL